MTSQVRFPPIPAMTGSDPLRSYGLRFKIKEMQGSFVALSFMLVASSTNVADDPFCAAIAGLKSEATHSGDAQRVAVMKLEEMTFLCRRTRTVAAQDAFCSAAMRKVGLEFTHAFPWYVYDCLKHEGVTPNLIQVDEYTGLANRARKKVMHLWAGWPDGARLDIQFKPSEPDAGVSQDYWQELAKDPQFRHYWGDYNVVVWKP